MLKNYLVTAIRNALRNRTYLAINVFGLGLALAFCIVVYMILGHNLEFDSYFPEVEKIYRVNEFREVPRREERVDMAPIPLAAALKDQFPGVEAVTRYIGWNVHVMRQEEAFLESIGFADANFMDFFPFEFIKGRFQANADLHYIYLTDKSAQKYFGSEDPMGQELTIFFGNNQRVEMTVGGIIKTPPFNTSFSFAGITHLSLFMRTMEVDETKWDNWRQAATFLKISTPEEAGRISSQLAPFVKLHNEAREEWAIDRMEIVPMSDPTLRDNTVYGGYTHYRVSNLIIGVFTLMARLILLIACFNLANTSVALMGQRMREIGVRKVLGGSTSAIFAQFFFEMFFVNTLGLVAGLAMAQFIIPEFWALWEVEFPLEDLSAINMIGGFSVLLLLASCIAGLYPALYSRGFQPVAIFRNSLRLRGTSMFNRVLITIQFALTITLLVAGLVFMQNADYITSLHLGYDKDELLAIPLNESSDYVGLSAAAKQHPKVQAVAGSRCHLNQEIHNWVLEVDTGKVNVSGYVVGEDYLETMGVRLLKGRMFDKNIATDSTEAVIVNQAYLERFDIQDPIGKMVKVSEEKRYIVGVVENMVDNIFEDAISVPFIYKLEGPEQYHFMVVRCAKEDRKEVGDFLRAEWNKQITVAPYLGAFQSDTSLRSAARDSQNLRVIFLYLGLLGGALSLAGIFALASLNVAKRTKEIGIRKVLGATSSSVVALINREFMILMGVASLLGAGLGYFVSDMLLEQIYRYHISVMPWHLLVGAGLVALAAFFTTSFTIFSAANANPVKSLRSE